MPDGTDGRMALVITPNRVLLALVGLVAAVAVAAAVVAVNRQPAELDPRLPEGVVQGYLQALLDGDYEAAAGYLSNGCEAEDLAQQWLPEQVRVGIRDVRVNGDNAVVEVDVVEISGGGLVSDYSYRHSEELWLRRGVSGWQLSGSPWPVYYCEGGR